MCSKVQLVFTSFKKQMIDKMTRLLIHIILHIMRMPIQSYLAIMDFSNSYLNVSLSEELFGTHICYNVSCTIYNVKYDCSTEQGMVER